ncbi:MAG: HAD-IA family hydrolase [Proteobacteria bacterium]|nr:HAD-IA family hydrolase [Pseudomonadota bacterium]
MRLAVFDCDGTLVDGQAGVVAAMARAFAAEGLAAPDPRMVRRIVGLSLPQAVARLAPTLGAEQRASVVEHYKAAFRTAREGGELVEPLFDGLAGVIETLAARGWVLGVATGKSRRGLDHCLAMHGLTRHFNTLQTADHHPSKPHPAMLEAALDEALATPGDAVMIGDTVYDIDMARAIGVRAIGVAWGYHAPEELIAAGAEAVARDAAHLLELLA